MVAAGDAPTMALHPTGGQSPGWYRGWPDQIGHRMNRGARIAAFLTRNLRHAHTEPLARDTSFRICG